MRAAATRHYLAAAAARRRAARAPRRSRPADAALRRADRPQRRAPELASGRPRAGLGAGAHRAPAAGLGRSGDYKSGPSPMRHNAARRSSRCAAIASSPNRPSACRSTAGRRRQRCLRGDQRAGGARQRRSRTREPCSIGYAFGKAQRILAGVDPSIGPIVVHGAVEPLNRAYRAAGVALPATRLVTEIADTRSCGARWWSRRRRRRARRGCAASATTATRSRAAGCSCAARAGAARVDRGFVLSRSRRLAGAAARDRRDRRRARDRHARLRSGDGALAARAGPRGGGVRHRVRRRRRRAPGADRRAEAQRCRPTTARHEALRRACSPSSTRTHRDAPPRSRR